ncbi:hypothetical protein JAAARDRAFT_167142 [Jaapia argillacea MUCL 33604]|uniref:Metal homeostatis protein bsd2 n=1 Tax=Jaapia argillacea MUCL 33604 TaxID=933084 RepID=A0A067QCG5_9AGAM|nr:hypothetical protein JAAARDRAFT_167142 [Jaapia argillacea MUCL 33604]
MSARYAPLPNPRTDPDAHNEMEAAFDDSDDEDDQNITESHPLNPNGPLVSSNSHHRTRPIATPPTPGTYDFENIDYANYPPPGSPPGPSAVALPNDMGNSNGVVPSFAAVDVASSRRDGWFGRTAAAILPTHYVQRLGIAPHVPSGPVGGGTNNDGVFANVTAKPAPPVQVQEGDQTYLVPEDSQKDMPPSYASAQADSVPPYWETTVHAPSTPSTAGEIVVEGLTTGSVFSFLWNMLVSISFQFVGFLLTYLLHTTHAAKLGSRAGLGVTLIQYGFALRTRAESPWSGMPGTEGGGQGGGPANDGTSWYGEGAPQPPQPTPSWGDGIPSGNVTWPSPSPDSAAMLISDATTEWLSFFLMTVGWFILLTSLLGFWRVKRWERNILSSQQNTSATAGIPQPYVSQIERMFGLQAPGSLFRNGLGLSSTSKVDDDLLAARERARLMSSGGTERVFEAAGVDPNDPDAVTRVAEAYAQEARLHQELRDAGLL